MIQRRIIASHVPPEAFEPNVCRALESLGYEIVPPRIASGTPGRPFRADLRIVGERSLGQLAGEEGTPIPVIILTSQPAPGIAEPRVVASLMRPASFQELYSAIQNALETTPRRHPRIATALAARCAYDDRSCTGAVISLSEGGCLFRSADELPRDREANLQLPLISGRGLLSMRAQQVDRRGSDWGLAFHDLPHESRSAISQYVMGRLIGS
jgi:hypothetical protein